MAGVFGVAGIEIVEAGESGVIWPSHEANRCLNIELAAYTGKHTQKLLVLSHRDGRW
uniref:Uncharacterized protein n=1 Tax=Anopheles quadriannulatus TaxID=34691 RepID=A0A182XQJ0_ANOQN